MELKGSLLQSGVVTTVRLWLLETSLWKLSTGFRPSFLVDIGNWLAGSGTLSIPKLRAAGPGAQNFARRHRTALPVPHRRCINHGEPSRSHHPPYTEYTLRRILHGTGMNIIITVHVPVVYNYRGSLSE